MTIHGFWTNLKKPIIGLSPMDGVTDAPFRTMVARHGHPSLMMTEFTNVEGLDHGAVKMLVAFLYSAIERPVVAQIYGVTPEAFYRATVMLCFLGFDGVDINMGCPANKVAKQGSGAALIRTPELAKAIVRECQRGARDWANGITLEDAGVHKDIIVACREMRESILEDCPHDVAVVSPRRHLPISVKTRVGYDRDVTEEWISHLLETRPAAISLHGRTLKQMYTGDSNWESIGKAAALVRPTETVFLGNGDVESLEQVTDYSTQYDVDGVLIGRAALGNPWFFSGHMPTLGERFEAMVEQCRLREKFMPELPFAPMRKHLLWYCKDFPGAKEMRMKLCRVDSTEEVETIIAEFLSTQ